MDARSHWLEQRIARLERAQRLQFAISRTTAPANDDGPVQTNQGKIDALSLRDGMPTLLNYGFSSSVPLGGDKAVMFLGGDRSQGVVIATGHQTYRFTGLQEGEVVMHDMWGRSIHMTEAGITVQAAGAPINVLDAGTVTMDTPLLKVKGDVIDNYESNNLTLAATRGVYDIHTHPIENVQGGESTLTTAVPNQQEL